MSSARVQPMDGRPADGRGRGLAAEIGKRDPFPYPEREVLLNVLRTCAQIEAVFNRFFRDFGLSSATYNVLRILRHHGEKGRTTTTVRSDMVRPVPDLTRLIDRLEADGLVKRTRCTEDRRVVYVAITPAGSALLDRIDGPLEQLERSLAGHLAADDLASLSHLLVQLRSGALVDEPQEA